MRPRRFVSLMMLGVLLAIAFLPMPDVSSRSIHKFVQSIYEVAPSIFIDQNKLIAEDSTKRVPLCMSERCLKSPSRQNCAFANLCIHEYKRTKRGAYCVEGVKTKPMSTLLTDLDVSREQRKIIRAVETMGAVSAIADMPPSAKVSVVGEVTLPSATDETKKVLCARYSGPDPVDAETMLRLIKEGPQAAAGAARLTRPKTPAPPSA